MIAARLGGVFHRNVAERELSEDLESHRAMVAEDGIRSGLPPDEGSRRASIALGNSLIIREAVRDQAGIPPLEIALHDIRYALRMMRRNRVFTTTVVLTVALAIGANTCIFSVVNAVLLRPMPFREPNRLLQVAEKNDKANLTNFGASVLNFASWREETRTFEELAAIGSSNYTLSGVGEPEQLSGNRISPALIRVLGIQPILGRGFTDEEEKPGAASVAMIGEGLWRRRFGGEPGVVGRTVTLNSTPTTIVGVAPAALNLISGGEIYGPLTIDFATENRLNHVIIVFGRLKPGVTFQQAQAEMHGIAVRLGKQYPEVRDWSIQLLTLLDTFVTPQLKTGLLVLLFAVGFVLLIACANVANLLLARAATRHKELAARAALGASRSRLVTQLVIESMVMSFAGGGAGMLGAFWAVRMINGALPPNVLSVPMVEIDNSVLWFAVGLTFLTGLLFGIAPAWKTTNIDLNEALRQAGRGSSNSLPVRFRHGLASAEIALATMLLIGAGLLVQSLANLQRVQLGFDAHYLMTFQLAPPVAKYPLNTQAPAIYRALINSLSSIPGVSGAAVSSGIPLGAGSYTSHPMLTTGQSILPPGSLVTIDWRIVSPGYFRTMEIPLLRGREFTDADGPSAPPGHNHQPRYGKEILGRR
jgi:predicted permease